MIPFIDSIVNKGNPFTQPKTNISLTISIEPCNTNIVSRVCVVEKVMAGLLNSTKTLNLVENCVFYHIIIINNMAYTKSVHLREPCSVPDIWDLGEKRAILAFSQYTKSVIVVF